MIKFAVQTEGRRQTRLLLKTVHDVDRYVEQVMSRSPRTVLVGDEDGELRPYGAWRMTRSEPLSRIALTTPATERLRG